MKSFWLATALLAAAVATPATAQRADVIHFYTSSSESLAIAVFAKDTTSAAAPGWTIRRLGHRRSWHWH